MFETPAGTKALVLPLTEDLEKLRLDHDNTLLYFDEELLYAIRVAQDSDRIDEIETELVTEFEKKLYERDADDDYVAQGAVELVNEVINRINFLSALIAKRLTELLGDTWIKEDVENVFFVADNVVVVCRTP